MSRPINLFNGWVLVFKAGICTFGAGWIDEGREVYLVCLGFFAAVFAKCDYQEFLKEWESERL